MPNEHPPLATMVRRSAAMARKLAETACLHHEPEVAARFRQIAAEGEIRAQHLDEITAAHTSLEAAAERRLAAEHEAAVRALGDE